MMSEYANTLARLLRGEPAEKVDLSGLSPDMREIADKIIASNGQGRIAAFQEAIVSRPDAESLFAAVFAADPDAQPIEVPEITDVPDLPEEIQVDLVTAKDAGTWLDLYIDHASARSPMTPNLFHEGLALWLGSVVIARRIGVHLPHGVVYPNLAIAWIATTTLWRKTTALDIGRGLIRRLIPHMLLPQETTPEALLSDLAGLEPPNIYTMSDDAQALFKMERNFAAQRGLMVDEMSGMLAGAGRDYNAGLIESFLKFYDCEELYVRSTRSQGRVAVRDAYLPILGASTPTAMAPHLGSERLWSMGWWPRFALLTPDADRPVWQTSRSVQESPELTGALLRLYSRLPSPIWPNPPQVVRAELGKGTLAAWERYAKAMSYDLLTPALNHRLFGLYGRLPTQVLKIAIILAALDWPTAAQTPLISEAHLARAILIAEGWRASAHRALLMARRHSFSSSLVDRVRSTLTRFQPAGGPTIRDLQRAIPDAERTELDAALRQLVEAGEANLVNCLSGPQGGRPTTRYRLVSS